MSEKKLKQSVAMKVYIDVQALEDNLHHVSEFLGEAREENAALKKRVAELEKELSDIHNGPLNYYGKVKMEHGRQSRPPWLADGGRTSGRFTLTDDGEWSAERVSGETECQYCYGTGISLAKGVR